MSIEPQKLARFLENGLCVLVKIIKAKGSTPREGGAWVLVSAAQLLGTIGGGQLEYIAIDSARQMLRTGENARDLNVPLGPEIGQCCGGHVALKLVLVSQPIAQDLKDNLAQDIARLPHAYIMGAGHVGRALALALAPLPFRTIVVDTRKEALLDLPCGVEACLSALPETEVRAAPSRSIFVILTHDHALDFMIAKEALARQDAAYVGMIGSKTKRATFLSWMKKTGTSQAVSRALICPIGGEKLADKRPEVIAALVAGEILVHTGAPQEKDNSEKSETQHAFLGGN